MGGGLIKMFDRSRANPHIYEISARPWLFSLGIDSLDAVSDQTIAEIKEFGFHFVWLMGVWSLGRYGLQFDIEKAERGDFQHHLPSCTKEDVIGSPYAITTPYTVSN